MPWEKLPLCQQVVVHSFERTLEHACVFLLFASPAAPPTQQKEKKVSMKAEEGEKMVLQCDRPQSSMKPIIHWMDSSENITPLQPPPDPSPHPVSLDHYSFSLSTI